MSEKTNNDSGDTLQTLPRVVYVADVLVESSYHGSALLYRLLRNYPKDKLLILQPYGSSSFSHRKLSGVTYREINLHSEGLLRSRFARAYRSWLVVTDKIRAGLIDNA